MGEWHMHGYPPVHGCLSCALDPNLGAAGRATWFGPSPLAQMNAEMAADAAMRRPYTPVAEGVQAGSVVSTRPMHRTESLLTDAQKKALEEARKRQKDAEVAKQAAGAGASPGSAAL